MTISNTSRTAGPFNCNGITRDFPFSFKVFSREDVLVATTVTATNVETIRTLDADYTVTLNADQDSTPGGMIRMLVAPPAGTKLSATSDVAIVQSLDLTNNGGFYPKAINEALDRIVINVQQLAARTGQGLGIGMQATIDTLLAMAANLAGSGGAGLIGWLRSGVGAVVVTLANWLERQQPTIFDFMTAAEVADTQKAVPVLDHTAAILAYKAYALLRLPFTMVFPKGKYRYSDIGNFAYKGLSIRGYNHRETILQTFAANKAALTIDAFKPGHTGNDATAPFVQQVNLSDLTVEGIASTPAILDLQGIARSVWRNVFVRNGEATGGIAVYMRGCMLNTFYNLGCSTDMDAMTSIPYEGLRMEAGSRNSINVGNSSNNTFVNAYFEGLGVGIRLAGADQNTFVSGSSESNSVYDVIIGATSRYNTFLGMGFESPNATANVGDAGIYTKYINCYGNNKMLLQGRSILIDGGYYQRIEVQAGAMRCTVKDVTVKHWEESHPGTGGMFDNGTATKWRDVWDSVAGAYVYPQSLRTGIAVGASPFTWTNNTGLPVDLIVQSGVMTQVRRFRGADNWLASKGAPESHFMPPGDAIEFSFEPANAPTLNYLPQQGF